MAVTHLLLETAMTICNRSLPAADQGVVGTVREHVARRGHIRRGPHVPSRARSLNQPRRRQEQQGIAIACR